MKEHKVSEIYYVRLEPANYKCPYCDNSDSHA